MFPVALRLGETVITWYGVLVSTGFLLGVVWASRQARRHGLSLAAVEWMAFWIILASVAGARLLFVLTDLRHYLAHPVEVFLPRQGGLVFLGGVLGALVAAAVYVRRRRLSFWRYADVMLPAVALGHAFGRVGCFAVGCCYGRPAPGLPWAVRFPVSPWVQIAPAGQPLHPVQLYEAGFDLALFALLAWALPRRRFDGQIGLAYLGLYAAGRIVLELARGDAARGFVLEPQLGPLISTGQATAAALLVAVAVAYAVRRRRARRPDQRSGNSASR